MKKIIININDLTVDESSQLFHYVTKILNEYPNKIKNMETLTIFYDCNDESYVIEINKK